MVKDNNDDLWLVLESGALTRYHKGIFHTYGPEDGIPEDAIRGTALDKFGNLWVLSQNSILKWNSKSSEFVDQTPAEVKIGYQPLRWENTGFWGKQASTLYIFAEGKLVEYALPAWLSHNAIWDVGIDGGRNIWIETYDGKQGLIPAGKTEIQTINPKTPLPITYRDAHGNLWTAHVGRHLVLSLDFVSSGKPATIEYTRFLEDKEGNVWVGTEGDGVADFLYGVDGQGNPYKPTGKLSHSWPSSDAQANVMCGTAPAGYAQKNCVATGYKPTFALGAGCKSYTCP